MEMREHLDEVVSQAEVLAGETGQTAAIFWLLVERLPWGERYELLQECEMRDWIIPRYMRLFQKFYEYQPEYEAKQEQLAYRRGWLATKYQNQTYWRKISGGN